MTIKQTIQKYSKELKQVTHIPQKEVQMMIQKILDKNTIWVHLHEDTQFNEDVKLNAMVQKRATNYPLEYILGKVSFFGELFDITHNVLIPRPETELLVQKAYDKLQSLRCPKVVEIGTGSGVISIMLACMIEKIHIVAVDINKDALKLAKQNAKKHKVEHKIDFVCGSLFDAVDSSQYFDMCVSNPPYIQRGYQLPKNVTFEPANALFGGEVGDELLKDIIDTTYKRKIPYLICEMGFDQKKSLEKYLKQYRTKCIEFYQDYESFDRGFELEFA